MSWDPASIYLGLVIGMVVGGLAATLGYHFGARS